MLKTGLLLCYDSRHAHARDFPILLAPEQAQPQTLRVGRADTDRAGNVAHQQLHGSNSVRAGNEGLRPVGSRGAAHVDTHADIVARQWDSNAIDADHDELRKVSQPARIDCHGLVSARDVSDSRRIVSSIRGARTTRPHRDNGKQDTRQRCATGVRTTVEGKAHESSGRSGRSRSGAASHVKLSSSLSVLSRTVKSLYRCPALAPLNDAPHSRP